MGKHRGEKIYDACINCRLAIPCILVVFLSLWGTKAAEVLAFDHLKCLHQVAQHGRQQQQQQLGTIKPQALPGVQHRDRGTSSKQGHRKLILTTASGREQAPSSKKKNTHVVIASFGEPEPYHAVSLYFASKLKGATVHHVIMHTYGKGHEPGELPLNVAREKEPSNGQEDAVTEHHRHHQQQPLPPIPWRTIYRRLNVHRHNVDLSIEESYHALARSYLHSSAREVDYELLCFARFIGLRRFCTERGIDELTFLDADVIVFDRKFLEKVRIPANHSLWTLHDHSSFLASMTCSSIGDFVDYMLAFYQQPDRREIVKKIETYGDDEIDPNKLQRLRDREPAFDALGIKPKLFTDMYLFDLFLHDQMERSRREGRGDADDADADTDGHSVMRGTLPPYVHSWEEGETRVRNGGRDDVSSSGGNNNNVSSKSSSTTATTTSTSTSTSDYYFKLIENMRSVTRVPHSRTWLCLDQTLFDAHFRISLSSQSARMNGNPDQEFKPLPGAHFQGDCKNQMTTLLQGDVMQSIGRMM